MMFNRKQVLVALSIVVASCLVGTLFEVNFAVKGNGDGSPWEKTWATISELQSKVDGLNAIIAELEARVSELESQPNTGFLSKPAFDSGWVNVGHGQYRIFTHNLNTTEVLVYVLGNTSATGYKINQMFYGGTRTSDMTYTEGLFWYALTNTTIHIRRYYDDLFWEQVRVMIWKIQLLP